jgi:hypothetical protein
MGHWGPCPVKWNCPIRNNQKIKKMLLHKDLGERQWDDAMIHSPWLPSDMLSYYIGLLNSTQLVLNFIYLAICLKAKFRYWFYGQQQQQQRCLSVHSFKWVYDLFKYYNIGDSLAFDVVTDIYQTFLLGVLYFVPTEGEQHAVNQQLLQ